MPETAARGRIFISYRREETAYPAGWLFDRLVDHFGEGQIFKDVDSIEPGDDFVDVITRAVGSCDVLLALIGSEWLTVTNEDGTRRIDNPGDFVRLEIEAALNRDVRVVPVLVDGAKMPSPEDLPASLAPLSRRHALELSPSRFDFETSRLLRVLDETLGQSPPEAAAPSAPPFWKRVRRTQLAAVGIGVVLVAALALGLAALSSGGEQSSSGMIFRDDFSTQASGWNDAGSARNGGHYVDGAYRLYTEWTSDHFSDDGVPRGAKSVFPKAPRDVSVAVTARRVIGGDQDAGYGVMCRANPGTSSYYQFAIWNDHIEIAKVTPTEPFFEQLASEGLSGVRPDGANQLRAVCANDGGAARLVFSVNGTEVASATDTNDPLSSGTVGLVVATGGEDAKAIEAEFDDFVVTPA